MQKAFGPHTIDLFAARHNTLLPRYFARFLDQEAAAEDALAQDWSEEHNPYAHPPFGLLPLVLRKVRRDQVKALTLVTPVWPAQHWLPDLMSMSVAPPTILTSDPLLTPHLSSHKPPSRPRWSTAVWRISGKVIHGCVAPNVKTAIVRTLTPRTHIDGQEGKILHIKE